MTELKILHRKLGGHIHCRVFVRTLPTETWANAGSLTFNEKEFPSIMSTLGSLANVLFLPEPGKWEQGEHYRPKAD